MLWKETAMSKRIGFVGLGQMGQSIALNLLKAGFAMRVFDLREERLAPLVAQGAYQVFQLQDVTEPGGIVLTMVPDEKALLQVTLGEGGILRQLGQRGIHLSLSTVSPEVAAQLAKLYEHEGSHYLSATVLGGPQEAEAARLSIFLSGNPTARSLVIPLLQALCTNIYDLGARVEVANVVNLGYTFLIAAAIEAMGEATELMEHYGVDRARFLHMLVESPLFKGTVYEGYSSNIGFRNYSDARFSVTMGLKEMDLVLKMAERVDVPLPYAWIVHGHLLAAQAYKRSQEDWSALADFVTQAVTGAADSVRRDRPR
jgi:3-hydroxyisobutyrate dehydrogenase-like beta-hydroxyacid dehydrogenase